MRKTTITSKEHGKPFTLEDYGRMVAAFMSYQHMMHDISKSDITLLTHKLTFLKAQAGIHQLIDLSPDCVRREIEHLEVCVEQQKFYNLDLRIKAWTNTDKV